MPNGSRIGSKCSRLWHSLFYSHTPIRLHLSTNSGDGEADTNLHFSIVNLTFSIIRPRCLLLRIRLVAIPHPSKRIGQSRFKDLAIAVPRRL